MGIDGEAIEFGWKMFPGFSSLSILHEIQQDLEKRKIQPEEFKDRIIFMSMFNDIDWKKRKDEKCISNAEEIRNYAMKFLQGPGSEEKWYGSFLTLKKRAIELYSRQHGATIQRKLVILCAKSISALSRGILKQKKGETSIHFN